MSRKEYWRKRAIADEMAERERSDAARDRALERKAPTTERVAAITDMMQDCAGMYTQAEEVNALAMERDQLRRALRYLSNEVIGSLGMDEHGMRQLIGNSNYNLMLLRAHEAREVLEAGE